MGLEQWVRSDEAKNERIADLEAALRALVGQRGNRMGGITYSEFGTECAYCNGPTIGKFVADIEHAPDCPIVLGRKLVGETEEKP